MADRDWTVLLIGGGSGTGKTQLSLELSRYFDVPLLEGDILRWVVESAVPEGSDPDLHPFKAPDFWYRPVDEIMDRSLRLSARLCQINEAVLARHHYVQRPLILEAFWILPEFAIQPSFDGVSMTGEVRSLFLFEPHAEALRARCLERDGEAGLHPDQPARFSAFYEHGIVVKQRAEALGLPVLESRPFETLTQRALAALGNA